MRVIAMGALLPLTLLAGGCATLIKGTSQTVTIATDPSGATCTLTRDAKAVAIVNPTPGSIPVEKARGEIAIDCRRTGYQDAAGQLAATFQPMTFGNILFGGIVGVVVDAASGAMNQYPDAVTITMIPAEFATVGDRDAFFDRMRDTLVRESLEARDRIAKMCQRDRCESELAAAQAGTTTKLAEIEHSRALARIAAPLPEAVVEGIAPGQAP